MADEKEFLELRIGVPVLSKGMDEWAEYIRTGEFVLFGWEIHDDKSYEQLKANLPKFIFLSRTEFVRSPNIKMRFEEQ